MKTHLFDQRIALNLISELARHLAAELDLNNDSFPAHLFAEELKVLADAKASLMAARQPIPDVVEHVLAGGAAKSLSPR